MPEPSSIDGISHPEEDAQVAPPPQPQTTGAVGRARGVLLLLFGFPYVLYIVWCSALLLLLPDPQGELLWLEHIGSMSALIGGGIVGLLFVLALLRIVAAKKAASPARMKAFIMTCLVMLPGIALSAAVPFLITREPPLHMTVVSPTDRMELTAPVAVTFSVEDAVTLLGKRGLTAVSYEWDFDNDGTSDEQTVVPTATRRFVQAGGYLVRSKILLRDGQQRIVSLRIDIPQAVFSISPIRPVVERPTTFSIAHLVEDPEQIQEVQWDFDDDGTPDEVVTGTDITYTFVKTGKKTISALVIFSTQVQRELRKTIEVYEPEPLPFEISILSEPETLIGPVPFGTLFRVDTQEPLRSVQWDFGDGAVSEGERVGHTYDDVGTYTVVVKAQSTDGPIAELSTVVRAVTPLKISDLTFEGEPEVINRKALSGELPVTVKLTPRTSLPLISFSWEAPNATEVISTEGTLEAIYRETGTYTIVLLGQNPDGHAMRHQLTLEVQRPSEWVSIHMDPEGGTAPLLVEFDASETFIPDREITGYEWLFGDEQQDTGRGGVQAKQAGSIVQHVFRKPGTYEITLYAYTTNGEVYEQKRTIVVRAPLIDACFIPSRTRGKAPFGVKFDMSCTTGVVQRTTWDFGDGSQSDLANPTHLFDRRGEYYVTLTVEDSAGSVSTETLTITVE